MIKDELQQSNFRYNVLTAIIYLFGVIIIMQLFNLQVVNGVTYRELSNTRLSREGTIEAARGRITDRTGVVLSSTIDSFSLEMFKTNVDNQMLNTSISLMTQILEQNGDGYINEFPISIDPFQYKFATEEETNAFKTKYKLPSTASAEEAFYLMRDKYEINSEDINEIARILAIRYAISTKGYSNTKSIKISNVISRNSAVQIQERSSELSGVNSVLETVSIAGAFSGSADLGSEDTAASSILKTNGESAITASSAFAAAAESLCAASFISPKIFFIASSAESSSTGSFLSGNSGAASGIF